MAVHLSRWVRCWILLWFVMPSAVVMARPPGLDAVQPAGKFFNGVFPASPPGSSGSWQAVEAFPGLTFRDPVRLVAEPHSNRLHVVGKEGYIWSFDDNPATSVKSLFLDISSNVQVTDNTGLVGLVFHPSFGDPASPNRGLFYVMYYYSPAPVPVGLNVVKNGYVRLSRFNVPDGQTIADPASEQILLQQYERHDWHNGGAMFFGNDGFLYFAIGDEGGDYDPYVTGQLRNKGMHGGVFRIDVDSDAARSHPIRRQPSPGGTPPAGWPGSFSAHYGIPDDNPWLHPDGSQLEEYWCLGIRSPHTMTYDEATGMIFEGDVGQGSREEVNRIVKGGNYQWPYMEGTLRLRATPNPVLGTEMPPVHSYLRSTGVCVICGPVYRGREHGSALTGKVLFADHEYRHVWALNPATTPATVEFLCDMPTGGFHANIAGWGVDHNGEPCMVKLAGYGSPNGKIYKLARTAVNVPDPPLRLSETGVFTDLQSLATAPGVLPYAVNSPLWTDGAAKRRWMIIPNDGQPNSAAEQIGYSATGDWSFPDGTVLIKHFELPVDETQPSLTAKIETRFLIRGNGGTWYAFTYQWREDQSDADLLFAGGSRTFTIQTQNGGTRSQIWPIPSRTECFNCHQTAAGIALGLKTHQMNGDCFYPATGRTANQLYTLSSVGLLNTPISEAAAAALPRACAENDFTQPVELRAKSYLDANCSHCHRPGSVQPAFDLRFHTPPDQMNVINNASVARPLNITSGAIVRPRTVAKSLLHFRANLAGANQMPPLGKNVVDASGVRTIEEWINSLRAEDYPDANGINAEYWNSSGATVFSTLKTSRVDAEVNFPATVWGALAPPGTTVNADNFAVKWDALLYVPTTGSYAFHVNAGDSTNKDNRVRLWVTNDFGQQQIISRWSTDWGPAEDSGLIQLTGGKYARLHLEMLDKLNSAWAVLSWTPPAGTKRVIPATQFFLPAEGGDHPVAASDTLTVNRGASATVHVLTNDFDPDGNLSASTVQIVTPPSHGSATVSPSGVITYTHGGGSAPASDILVYSVSDSTALTSNRAAVYVTIDHPFFNAYFSAAERSDPAISGWNADPDEDGASNLLEYALDTHPRQGASRPALVVWINGVHFEVIFSRPVLPDVVLTPEAAADPSAWASSPPEVEIILNSPTALGLRVPLASDFRYLRLRASLMP